MALAAHCTPMPREKLHGAVRRDGNDSNESDGVTNGQIVRANVSSERNSPYKPC